MKELLVFILLIILTISDVKKREISLAVISLFAIIGVIMIGIDSDRDIWGIIIGILVGIMLIFFSYISREGIGYGDGLVFIVTGLYLGGYRNIELLLTSVFLASLYGIIIFIICKNYRKRIPFIPFIMLSFIVTNLAGVIL